jgi:hypothetical protein
MRERLGRTGSYCGPGEIEKVCISSSMPCGRTDPFRNGRVVAVEYPSSTPGVTVEYPSSTPGVTVKYPSSTPGVTVEYPYRRICLTIPCGRTYGRVQTETNAIKAETSHGKSRRLAPSRSRRRCGSGEHSRGADVAAVSAVPAQMWQRRPQSRRRCGSGERSHGADVAAVSAVPAQMWQR